MMTRTRINARHSRLLIGLVVGLLSFSASAMEEVVVNGNDAAADEAQSARLEAELAQYLEALNERLKERLDENFKQRPAASVKLALAEIPSRG